MIKTEKHPCPSCVNGAGPMGLYSARPPRCEDCYGTGYVLRCSRCGEVVGVEGCEYCAQNQALQRSTNDKRRNKAAPFEVV